MVRLSCALFLDGLFAPCVGRALKLADVSFLFPGPKYLKVGSPKPFAGTEIVTKIRSASCQHQCNTVLEVAL